MHKSVGVDFNKFRLFNFAEIFTVVWNINTSDLDRFS